MFTECSQSYSIILNEEKSTKSDFFFIFTSRRYSPFAGYSPFTGDFFMSKKETGDCVNGDVSP